MLYASLGVGLFAVGGNAATTPLYGGGVTLSSKVWRNIFDAYGNTGGGDLCIGVAACAASTYRSDVEILYLGVTSGNAGKALDADNPSLFVAGNKLPQNPPVASTRDFGPFYGTGTGANWAPVAGGGPAFPKISFASADALTTKDVNAVTALGFGPPLQVPALVTATVLTFNPTPGWNPKGNPPSGSSSKVQISTNTLCGIYSGKITDWSDPAITKDNKNFRLGSGVITIVYRNDSAATTFLLSDALLNQCGTTSNPVSTYPIPDQWLTDNSIANTPPYYSNNSFFINVFNAKHLPANYYNNLGFAGVTGGVVTFTGMQEAVDATPGSIGYLSTDYALPVQTGNDPKGNPVAAGLNLQTYYSFINNLTPKYVAPTTATTTPIVATINPPSFSGSPAPAQNPLNWATATPTPTNIGAYPIGGFTYFDFYSCYASAADVDALVGTTPGKLGLMRWYFGSQTENSGIPTIDLEHSGFSPVSSGWIGPIKQLLALDARTRIGTPGQASTPCASITKGA